MTKRHPDAPDFDELYVDADILCYEKPFGAEYRDDEGDKQVRDFDFVINSLSHWDKYIRARLGCDKLRYFLTGKGNFREKIAVSKPYKDKRPPKPFHHKATRDWLIHKHNAEVVEGMEADDIMSYYQAEAIKQGRTTCIVSRDKDLKMTEGWFYSWSVGNQKECLQRGGNGWLELEIKGKKKKVLGGGIKWFYYQLMVGDPVDTIPALKGVGPVKAASTLIDADTEQEMFSRVRTLYHELGYTDEYLLEQARLLYMIKEMKDGKPVMWVPPLEMTDE